MSASHAIDTETEDAEPRQRVTRPDAPPRGPARGRAGAAALVRACRPRQWAKNVLVLAAPAAAGRIGRDAVLTELLVAFVAMCMASSATYLVNDVRDLEQDRKHPRKRTRPIAAGEISARTALTWAVVLAVGAIALALSATLALAAVVVAYLALTGAYSLWLRRVPIADIVAVAAGFVLRALAGGAATDIRLSRWFILVTGFGAVFLVACKRYAELREHRANSGTRSTLAVYTPQRLQAIILTAAFGITASYVGWAITRSDDAWLFAASALPLLLWLVRYGALVGAGRGQVPEDLVLRDAGLLACGALWAVACGVGIYAGV